MPRSTRTVLFYAPLAEEIDVWPLLRETLAAGRQVALPRFDRAAGKYVACCVSDIEAELVAGRFGIREPAERCPGLDGARADWILVPGEAFDLNGNRLGRGAGFYDRLLCEIRGTRCGVAFDEQIVRELPAEPHDMRMALVVTPTRRIAASARESPGLSGDKSTHF